MDKIVTQEQAVKVSEKLRQAGKKIVVAGGCFDILHIGHIRFLKASKETADVLFVLLESDENVKRFKGNNRPINCQKDRAEVLASLSFVDYVICLPPLLTNDAYDSVILSLKPAIITTTTGDTGRVHKKRQASLINGELIDVIMRINNKSTSRIAMLLETEL